jgi:hypothetical protein
MIEKSNSIIMIQLAVRYLINLQKNSKVDETLKVNPLSPFILG